MKNIRGSITKINGRYSQLTTAAAIFANKMPVFLASGKIDPNLPRMLKPAESELNRNNLIHEKEELLQKKKIVCIYLSLEISATKRMTPDWKPPPKNIHLSIASIKVCQSVRLTCQTSCKACKENVVERIAKVDQKPCCDDRKSQHRHGSL